MALPEIIPIALFLFCFAFVWTARKLLAAMFQSIIDAVNSAHIPYLGGYIADGLHAMEQAVDNALGSIEHGIDSLIGESWHLLARQIGWLWREFTQHTLLGYLTAQLVAELTHGYRYLHGRIDSLHGTHTRDTARIKRLEREYHGIEGKIKTLEHDLSKGIGNDVLPRLRTLEKEAAHIETVELPAAIAAQRQADNAIGNLYDWARGKASLIGVGTFSLAVAAALETLGLGGLRCPSLLKSLGNRGCGLWNGLEDVLGLFVDLFVIADLCEVIPLLETAYSEIAAPAVAILTEAIDAMPCVAGNQAPALTVPRLYLPTTTYLTPSAA